MIDFDGDDGVDLRSDTLTRPTPAMYGRMVSAKLCDDGLDHDPTAYELEETTATLLRKEAALFVPSCTMANLLAVLVQVQRSEQILLEASAHMITTERGAATLTGAFFLGLPGHDGALDLDRLDDALRPSASPLRTALVAVETTHNAAGGMVPSLSHMAVVADMSSAVERAASAGVIRPILHFIEAVGHVRGHQSPFVITWAWSAWRT